MARITITDSGQTTTYNGPDQPDQPDDSLQRISSVYFAKKLVTQNGANLAFTKIDSAHTQTDGTTAVLPYDAVLGQTIYLVIETSNMAEMEIDVIFKPSNTTLTGNTNSLSLMRFDPAAAAGSEFVGTTLFTTKVGNFDALNNRNNSHAHYTNLTANHVNKAFVKLQLRPSTAALFNTWAANLGTGTANIEVVVQRHDKQPCAYGPTSTVEVNGAETFLNSAALGRFRIVNRNFFVAYHANNAYNIYAMNGAARKRLGKLDNASSTQTTYFYVDRYDNELNVATCNITTVRRRGNGQVTQTVPPSSISNSPAPGGEAQTNYYYADGRIATRGTNANRVVTYARLAGNVTLVRMPNGLAVNQNGAIINFIFTGTQRQFCNPQCFAAFVGALAQYGAQMTSSGMCFGDATSYPSQSHPNGDSIDTFYASTLAVEQRKVNAFHEYGFTNILRGSSSFYGQLTNSRYHPHHESHLHSGDFDDVFLHDLLT